MLPTPVASGNGFEVIRGHDDDSDHCLYVDRELTAQEALALWRRINAQPYWDLSWLREHLGALGFKPW